MSHQPNNIFAGTQVVSLVEVRGTNNSLVHPRGAVGVVTRTPAVAGEKFLVRFPDGFEAALASAELDVLKHFKDGFGPGPRLSRAAAATDTETRISAAQADSAGDIAAGQETRAPEDGVQAPPDFHLESFII
jgi:hypothetical protein